MRTPQAAPALERRAQAHLQRGPEVRGRGHAHRRRRRRGDVRVHAARRPARSPQALGPREGVSLPKTEGRPRLPGPGIRLAADSCYFHRSAVRPIFAPSDRQRVRDRKMALNWRAHRLRRHLCFKLLFQEIPNMPGSSTP